MALQIDILDDDTDADTDYIPSEGEDDSDEYEDYEPPHESIESLPRKNILIYH